MKKIKRLFSWTLKSRVRAIIFVLLIFGLGFVVYKSRVDSTGSPQYQTAIVEKATIVSTVSASGQAILANNIPVTTQTAGLVEKVYVKDGDKVVKGQRIATTVQNSDAQRASSQAYVNYISAKNSLASAQNNLYTLDAQMWSANQKFENDAVARGLDPSDPSYIQENDAWLAAEATYKNQQNVISQAQLSLNNAWLSYQSTSPNITSPTSGVIASISVADGMVLSGVNSSTSGSSSTQIAVIQTEGNPIISLNVSEIDIPNIETGQKATVTFDSISNKTFTGKVVSVNKIGSVSSGVTNYPVMVTLDTASPEILPNMSASANIIIATKDNVLLVPSSAIQTQQGEDVVRVLNNGVIENVIVVAGLSSDTQIEIVRGLSEGQMVVTGSVSTATGQSSSSSIFSRGIGGAGGTRTFTGGGR
ncbi:MAG: hypothetical protein UT39_C0012G0001 [Candidatus Woesebacteria bacterium GW2011_GWA1_39_21]|uniref:RND efflux pump membrane fusion protein barrel-sandwich domain-containing protein n=1 Tax=Candidatus Woesebacteria bacterium GW2011_GWA1_39_21 TaxID=1618550 RepID=A0A0G0N427_9BACT|nr:MAG: hypothetical protein UT39_C0012G0001 [Candidatus Woesebacteria bacterium GW2011_GWA1_39_21]